MLLRHTGVKGQSFWAPPGGGLERGETFEEAARREASEELGITPLSLELLWERTADFVYIDQPVRQHECYFLIEEPPSQVSSDTQKVHTQEGILEMRWWTSDELDSSSELIFPENLAADLKKTRR